MEWCQREYFQEQTGLKQASILTARTQFGGKIDEAIEVLGKRQNDKLSYLRPYYTYKVIMRGKSYY